MLELDLRTQNWVRIITFGAVNGPNEARLGTEHCEQGLLSVELGFVVLWGALI